MAAKKKNSLVGNINRRKKAGKSRPRSRSTISTDAYDQMQAGWPGKKKKSRKKSPAKKKAASSKRSKRA
jgi:hypothetical protein